MRGQRLSLESASRRINKIALAEMQSSEVRWYVLVVVTGKEFLVQRLLYKQGFLAYLPLCRKWRRVNRYRSEREKFSYPIISGCLFARFPTGQERWFALFSSAASIRYVLGSAGSPSGVESKKLLDFIGANRIQCGKMGEKGDPFLLQEFKRGDHVRIINGPMSECVLKMGDVLGKKAHIFAELLGSEKLIEIPVDRLEKAE